MNNEGKIKILHTIRQGQISGGEAHVYDLVTNLNRNEFEPVVLSFRNGPVVELLKEKKHTVYVVDTIKPFNIRTFNQVQSIMRKEQIDILHAHGTRALSNTILPAKALGIPVIYTVHGWAFHDDQRFPVRKARQLSEKLLVNNADQIISITSAQLRDGIHSINLKKSTVINYGVDLNRFNPVKVTRDIRTQLGIEEGKTTVGYVTRFNKGKDPFNFINAVDYIKKRNCTSMQFVMIGDGDLKEATMRYARELEVQDMVTFHPYCSDLPAVLNSIDIYCLPSAWERFPIGVLEAMAMRKAIVATGINGIKEVVKNNFNGVIVPVNDAEQLALALMRLHFNPDARNELAERALQTAIKNFNLQISVRQNEQIYKSFFQKKMSA